MITSQNPAWLAITIACFLASASSAQQPKLRRTLNHVNGTHCVAVSPDGKIIVSGGGNTIRLWDVDTGKERATIDKAAKHGVDSLAFSPDGRTLACGAGGNVITLFDVATLKPTVLRDTVQQYAGPMVLFSADGKTLVTGGRCIREILIWDVAAGKQTAKLKGHDAYGVRAMTFLADGKTLATVGSYRPNIKLWDPAVGKEVPLLQKADRERIEKLIPKLGSEKFADRDAAGKEIEAIGPVAIGPLKKAAKDEDVEISRRARELVARFKDREIASQAGYHPSFSPDGKTVATAMCVIEEINRENVITDKSIKLWDLSSGNVKIVLKGHAERATYTLFSPDGKTLATAAEKTIKFWDIATGKEIASFEAHAGEIHCLAFSPDGTMLMSGGADKTINVWDMSR